MLLDSRSELSASRLRDLRLHRKESTKHPSIRTAPNVSYSDHAFTKPEVITVFRCGAECPQPNIKILLNRQSVQTFEQFVKDVSDGFGFKARKHQLKKLFTLSGREVRGMSDMFRDDDIFIAVGNEDFNTTKLREVLNEIYQTNSHVEAMTKMWEKTNSRGNSRDVNWSLSERESVYKSFEREKTGNKEDKRLNRKSIDREVHNKNNDVKMQGLAKDAWSEAENVQTDEKKIREDEEDLNPRKIRASVLNLKKKRAAHLERLAELERQSDWSEMEMKQLEQNEKERFKQRQLELLEEVRQKKIETLEKKRKEL